jgi:AcrR family transcriptional regulator
MADPPDHRGPEPRTPDSRGPRQQQADATRRHLLASAGNVFATSGYQAATVRAITDRASTAHGTFYLYFHNKEDAFCQVIEAVIVDELAAGTFTILDAGPDRDGLARAIRDFVTDYSRHLGLWRALLEGMLQSRAVRELWLDLRRRTVLRLASQMQDHLDRGDVRPLDPLLTAHALTSMTEWFAFTHLALDEPAPEGGRTEAAIDTLADLWLHAVFGRVDGQGA